jgi:hypothetical protein
MESSATLLQKPTKCINIFSHTSEEMCIEGLVRICERKRLLGKPRNRCNINEDLREVGQEGILTQDSANGRLL